MKLENENSKKQDSGMYNKKDSLDKTVEDLKKLEKLEKEIAELEKETKN